MAKSKLLLKLRDKIFKGIVIPTVLRVYRALQRLRSPLIKALIPYLVHLYELQKEAVEECLLTFQDEDYSHHMKNKAISRPINIGRTVLREIQNFSLKEKQRLQEADQIQRIKEVDELVSLSPIECIIGF